MSRVALVTGSTNNIGKGIAIGLSRDGFLVIVTSRHEDEARDVAAYLPTKGAFFQVDFTDPEQISGLFAFVKKTYGRLDVLVNNVAYTANESILECTLDIWERTINTNLRSFYLCTRHAAEIMKEHGGGSIINITVGGAAATAGGKQKFAYTVAKGGVNSLTKCAAADLAPFNIRVNAVSIGQMGTPVGSKEHPDRRREYALPSVLAGHIGMPEDVANAVSFLVSEKASYIWGAVIAVDGGR
jgi:NAD(P)-dependent dehydrogenase (short-subunit alcohol dehydrogenase family)